jgi:transcriptional regulator with XRE-family HTH domain
VNGIVGAEELGARVRRLRIERRQTLKQVEEACGLSATHLSEIERGRTSPTLGALTRIARALGRDASFFLEVEEMPDVAHLPRERVTGFMAGGARVEPLTGGVPGSQLLAYRVLLTDTPFSLPAQDGDALYFVRQGRVEGTLGPTRLDLRPGDAVQGRLHHPHELRALDGAPAEVIALLTRRIEEST